MTYRPYSVIIAAAQANNSTQTVSVLNNTGSTILKLTPVSINSSGELSLINVASDQSSLSSIGIASEDIPDSSSGNIVISGRLANITTTFVFGDFLYVSKTGGLTDVAPSIGVDGFLAGDSVIKIGVIVKNATNPTQKDLLVNMELVGKL